MAAKRDKLRQNLWKRNFKL